MNFSESIKVCFKKIFTIKGRASRSEYWWFHLMWVICYVILLLTADQASQFAYPLYWMIVGVLVISIIPLEGYMIVINLEHIYFLASYLL